MNKLAQIKLSPDEGFAGFGSLGLKENGGEEAISTFTKFLSGTIGLMTIIAIIWFVFVLITGAIGIISSGGDKTALETARKRITTGLVGLIVVIAALFIIDLIGFIIGIDILNIEHLFGLITE